MSRLHRYGEDDCLGAFNSAEVVRRSAALARDFGLQPEEMREVFWHIIGMCRRAQTEDV